MGRNAKVKQMRKILKQVGMDNPKPKSIDSMIECPFCHAWSYPRGYRNPKDDVEKKAILCGSCHRDLTPIIEKRKREAEEKEALQKGIRDRPRDAPLDVEATEVVNENT